MPNSSRVEVEGFWKPGNGFAISLGGGYTDAEITGVPETSMDVKEGNDVPYTPNWNATVSISHNLPLPSFWGMKSPSLFSSVTNRYVGERNGDAANSFEKDRLSVVGVAIRTEVFDEIVSRFLKENPDEIIFQFDDSKTAV
jgi:hypothetical protein